MSLRPTGTCFDDALEFLEVLVRLRKATPAQIARDARVVHGICLAPGDGLRFAHGWVRLVPHELIVQGGIDDAKSERVWRVDTAEAFRRYMRPQQTTTYTVREFVELNQKHGTTGPWLPEYLALCGDGVFW
jgi:hypothetical protein